MLLAGAVERVAEARARCFERMQDTGWRCPRVSLAWGGAVPTCESASAPSCQVRPVQRRQHRDGTDREPHIIRFCAIEIPRQVRGLSSHASSGEERSLTCENQAGTTSISGPRPCTVYRVSCTSPSHLEPIETWQTNKR